MEIFSFGHAPATIPVFPQELFLLQHLQGHSRTKEWCSASEDHMFCEILPVESSLKCSLWEQKMRHFSVLGTSKTRPDSSCSMFQFK